MHENDFILFPEPGTDVSLGDDSEKTELSHHIQLHLLRTDISSCFYRRGTSWPGPRLQLEAAA